MTLSTSSTSDAGAAKAEEGQNVDKQIGFEGGNESNKSENMELVGETLGHIGSLLGALCGNDDVLGSSWLHSCPMSFTAGRVPLAALARGTAVAFRRISEEGAKDTVLSDVGSQDEIDAVAALQWVEAELLQEGAEGEYDDQPHGAERRQEQEAVLLVGCSSGLIRIYDMDGKLVHSQTFHAAGIKSFRLRGHGAADRTQDLLVVYDDSVVARVDGATIISLLKAWRTGSHITHLNHCKWKMRSQDGLADAVCCGLDEQAQTSDFWGALYYKLIVGGSRPSLALYAACDERNTSSAKEVLSKVTTAAWSMAKSYLWGGGGEQGDESGAKAHAAKALEPPRHVTACDALDDPSRQIRSLRLEPHGRLVAASDELGRVTLLDVEDFFVLRMWKGYRESECAWATAARARHDARAHAHDKAMEGDGGTRARGGANLCLLIYAPRRRILEAWHTASGLRVGATRFGAATRLMQAEAPLREYAEDEEDGSTADFEQEITSEDQGKESDESAGAGQQSVAGGQQAKEVGAQQGQYEGTTHGNPYTHVGGSQAACITVDVVGTVMVWRVVVK